MLKEFTAHFRRKEHDVSKRRQENTERYQVFQHDVREERYDIICDVILAGVVFVDFKLGFFVFRQAAFLMLDSHAVRVVRTHFVQCNDVQEH